MADLIATMQAAAGAGGGVVEPVGIDFDGTNDYLSRSSDLTGNSDGKEFTFSAWVYPIYDGSNRWLYHSSSYAVDDGIDIFLNGSGRVFVYGYSASSSQILNASTSASLPENTWSHILISVDLSNASNRHIYVNDASSSASFSAYSNVNINFTNTSHYIFGMPSPYTPTDGRIAGVYLDYTYRDLSVEANRRDFIDENGLYVTPPTSGIISVPMDDPDDPGRNDGTGGDFTLNGIVAQSGRGPNQYNAVASTFDGSADYLSRSSITGISDGKAITAVITFKPESAAIGRLWQTGVVSGSEGGMWFLYRGDLGGTLNIDVYSSSPSRIAQFISTDEFKPKAYYTLAVSFDLTNSSNRQVLVNGVSVAGSWGTYNNDTIDLVNATGFGVGATGDGSQKFGGELSDFWFDDSYTADLSGFYDTETGKPKFLGASGELPTGSSPLIYLPLRADDAGNNLGTGGDFTVNSGPYVGARGPSEYLARGANFDGSTGHLTSSGIGASNGKTASLFCAFKHATEGAIFSIDNGFSVWTDGAARSLYVLGRNTSSTNTLYATYGSGTTANEWHTLLMTVDMSNTALNKVYVDGVLQSQTAFSSLDDNMNLSNSPINIGKPYSATGAVYWSDDLASVYFTTDYIDFSQEYNRLKFVDAFGYPVDLAPAIEAGDISEPLVYMKFEDPSSLGTNSGTGGDFTVTATVTAGSDVDPS